VIQFLTVAMSKSPADALQRVLVQQVNWTAIFVIAAYFGRIPGRAERFIALLVLMSLPIAAITIVEAFEQHVLWADHVPGFLKVEDPAVRNMLGAHTRGATHLYRAKATFSTALGLAEYMGLLTPFAIHYAVGPYSRWVKAFGVLMLPLIFYVVRLTDARLGVV